MGVGDNEHVALGASGKAGDHVKLEDSFETSCYEGTLAGTDRCCARQCSSTHSSTHDLEGMLRRDAELADVPREVSQCFLCLLLFRMAWFLVFGLLFRKNIFKSCRPTVFLSSETWSCGLCS